MTEWLVTALFLVCSLAAGLLASQRAMGLARDHACAWWAGAAGLEALALLLALGWGMADSALHCLVAGLLLGGAQLLRLEGLLRFAERQGRDHWLWLPAMALALLGTSQLAYAPLRLLLLGSFALALSTACVAATLSLPQPHWRSRSALAASLLLSSAAAAAVTLPSLGLVAQTTALQWALHLHLGGLCSATVLLAYLELERETQRNAALATLDRLTGLYNRRALLQFGQRELARAQRRQRPLSVLLVQLEDLVAINTLRGQQSGDQALCQLARRLLSTAQRHDLCARFGGSSFAIVLPDTPFDGAEHVAQRLLAAADEREGLRHSLSLGFAERAPSEFSIEALLTRADLALQRARRHGGGHMEGDRHSSTSRATLGQAGASAFSAGR